MADIKQMSFMLLVLLVSVSALYETMLAEDADENKIFPAVADNLGIATIDDFSASTLTGTLNTMNVDVNTIFTTSPLTDLTSFINALTSFFASVWGIFMKLMFGWQQLVSAIFASIGLPELEILFIAPLTIIQIISAFYFLRDLVNTIRGVGGA